MDLEKFRNLIKRTLPTNSLVVFHVEEDEIEEVTACLSELKEIFGRYGISAVCCPKSIAVTVIPSGTKASRVLTHKGEAH